jgi:hypothetical protein
MATINPYRKTVAKEKVVERVFDSSGKINPKLPKSSSRFFDKKGQLNAGSRKEVAQLIDMLLNDKKIGNELEMAKKAMYRKNSELDPYLRREIILSHMQTQQGMKKLGEELLAPIKNLLDYEGIARKFLRIRPLAQGEVHRIPKDIWVTAHIVGQDGQSVISQAYGRYVNPVDFKVTSFLEVDINDIYQMQFDVLERGQDLAKQMIMLKEDQGLVKAFTKAATTLNSPIYFTNFTLGTFEDLRYQVERHRLIADKFLVNRQEVGSFLKNMHNDVDFVTERELILRGYIANIFNVQVIVTAGVGVQEVVPRGTVFVCTEGTFLGEMGIRLDLQSEPYNKFMLQETKKGWAFFEIINQTVVNPRAVAMGIRV